MAGTILLDYATTTSLTVTNLHSLAADNTSGYPLIGWSSQTITNTSNEYVDYLISLSVTMSSASRQSGAIWVYVIAALNDSGTFPAAATGTWGTEGAASFTDSEERDGFARLLAVLPVDDTSAAVYGMPPTGIAQLFGGYVPTHFCLFISTNGATTTAAALASSGNAVYSTPLGLRYT